jgi:hypothetical protein
VGLVGARRDGAARRPGLWAVPFALAWLAGAVLLASAGCSSPPTLEGDGDPCFQVSDCELGLLCVPLANNTSVCSADAAGVVMTEGDGSSLTTSSMTTVGLDAGGGTMPEASPGAAGE